MALTREQIRAWTIASCDAQGVAVGVSDPGIVTDVAVLLTGGRVARRPQGAATDPRSHPRQTGRTRDGSNATDGVPGPITA